MDESPWVVAGFGAIAAVVLLAIGQIPELSFALSIMRVGGLIGTLRAAGKKRRDPAFETLPTQALWMAAGFVAGWIVVVVDALL